MYAATEVGLFIVCISVVKQDFYTNAYASYSHLCWENSLYIFIVFSCLPNVHVLYFNYSSSIFFTTDFIFNTNGNKFRATVHDISSLLFF
jgi:hypothetical protein